MRFVIVGAGAVGGVVGGFWARAGCEVVLIARGAQLAAVAEAGLRVETPVESFVVRPAVADHPARIAWRPDDVAVLAVKTQDAAAALIDLAQAAPRTPVLCMTNGVEAERLALRHVAEVHAACVMLPATYLAPGVVQAWAAPSPGAIDLGRYPDGGDRVSAAIVDALRTAGFASELRPEIMRWKRGKLLANLANAIEALCGRPARQSELAERARREATACFAAARLSCTTTEEYDARNAGTQPQPIGGVTRAGGSTWQSLSRGARALETDYLNGEIVLLGRLHGVATPVNAFLQHFAAEAARRGVAPGSMSVAELAALAGPV